MKELIQKLVELDYAAIAVVCLLGTAGFAVLHGLISVMMRGKGEKVERPRWGILEKLIYLGLVLMVAVLGVTSLWSVVPEGTMHGWWLFAHLVAAGAFVGLAPLLGLMWLRRNLLFDKDLKFVTLARLGFWVLMIGAVGVVGSILAAMLGLVGGELMHEAVDIHRYSGLAVVCGVVLNVYAVVLMKIGVK